MHPGFFATLFWSMAVFVSFLGYGETLRRRLHCKEFSDVEWGLKASWGMAVMLGIGGVLMCFQAARALNLVIMVIAGVALALHHLICFLNQTLSAKGRKSLSLRQFPLSDFFLYLLAALIFASSISWPHQIDPNDDLICYFMLPEKILQTGTLIEPFSFRRAGSLGGHWFLEALVMLVGTETSAHVVDSGLARVILFGIVLGLFPQARGWNRFQRFGLALMALLYPIPRINTMSALTGTVCLLGLGASIAKLPPPTGSLRRWTPAILLTASAALMRPYFGLAAGGILVSGLALSLPFRKPEFGRSLFHAMTALACAALLVLPWSIVLYFSNATFYAPPFSGNLNPLFMETKQAGFLSALPSWSFFSQPEIFPLFLMMFAGMALGGGLFAFCLCIACMMVSLAVCHLLSATPINELPRYIIPLLLPGALFLAGSISVQSTWKRGLTVLFLIIPLAVNAGAILREQTEKMSMLFGILEVQKKWYPESSSPYFSALRQLQSQVPRGEKTLAVVDFPYLLDFQRNETTCIDVIGAAGPHGGIPFFQGKDALNDYLRRLGVRYVLCMDFNSALLLYNRQYWQNHPRSEWYYRTIWAPRFLDFMDNMDSLSDWGTVVGSAANVRLIKLPD